MNIGLIGYGKMGKAIEEIALERGHQIVFKADSAHPISPDIIATADVAIEFSLPELAVKHIEMAAESKTPIVVGTTGWNAILEEVEKIVNTQNGSLIHASNYSIGVNIFFELNSKLAELLSEHPEHQACITETHHLQKLDSPSGTAISLANEILNHHDSYLSWVAGDGTPPHVNSNQLGVTAIRLPGVPGTHTVKYQSEIDTISITHEAHNRKGFALGAVIAAEWILNKQGVFTMKDVLNN